MNDEAYLKTWNTYQQAWGPIEDAERRDLLSQSVADDIAYNDPASQVEGLDALAARIAATQRQYPGASFRNHGFLEHHGQGLFHWSMYDKDGTEFVKGSSFARFGKDGRLTQATGFFETPKS